MQVHVGAKKVIIIHLYRRLKCGLSVFFILKSSHIYLIIVTTHKYFATDKTLFDYRKDKLCLVKLGHHKQCILVTKYAKYTS